MGIVFFCQSCGARFEVEPRMAGKKGRCRKCGQYTTIPRAEEIASLTALPVRPAAAGAAVVGRAGPIGKADDPAGPSIGARIKAGLSSVALAPLTLEKVPRLRKPDPLDDAEDSRPYMLARPMVETRGRVRVQDNILLRFWRREIGGIQKVFRWLNESAYFVSIPFIMILLFGTVVKNRPIALFGATFVVLLNLGRLAAGAVELFVAPFRDGLNVGKLKKPARRVGEPFVTIVLVFLGFTFIPWLSGSRLGRGSLPDRIRDGAAGLEKEIEGEVDSVVKKARKIDIEKLGEQAREKFKATGEPAEPAKTP
jgi:hypothetical protein